MDSKFDKLFNKIISEQINTDRDRQKRLAIFEKEMPEIVEKINKFFKNQNLTCTVRATPGIFFSDGYFQKLKFETNGSDGNGKEWWEWFNILDHSKIAETKHLFYYAESGHGTCIYLKDGWRPTSFRGVVGAPTVTFAEYWRSR